MRKADSIYSQTFCMVGFCLNPLSHGHFWKIKLPLHCCSSLVGMSHTLSMRSKSPGMAGRLCKRAALDLSLQRFSCPFGLMASSACRSFLASLCRCGGVFSWVPCLSVHSCEPQHTPAALKHLWTSWTIFSYPREVWILYWIVIPCLFKLLIIMCFPRIGFKGFPVFNSWIFFLYPCFFRAFLFLVVDTANPQSTLPGKTGNLPIGSENIANQCSLLLLHLSQLTAWQKVARWYAQPGVFCILDKALISPCLGLCVHVLCPLKVR